MTGPHTLRLTPIAEADAAVRLLFDAQEKPEGSWAWFDTLAQSTLRDEQAAQIAVLFAGKTPLAALPLRRDRAGLTSLTAPYTTCFLPPLGPAAESFGRLLGARLSERLALEALDLSQPGMRDFLNGLSAGGLMTARYVHFANWHETIADFSTYWSARSGRLRSTVQKKLARLTKPGRINFEQIDLAQQSGRGVEIFQSIYAKSWKSPEPDPGFIPTACEKLGARNLARLAVAWIDGEAAAAQIWLVQRPFATIFKLAHDPKFDPFSAGTLLTHWLLETLWGQDGVREVDFGRGDDAYKREWLANCRHRHGLIGFSPRTARGLYGIVSEILPTRIARRLRSGSSSE